MQPFTERPYFLFGHSFGALVAFEVARALRRSGSRTPDHLFVSAAPAPQRGWPHRQLHCMHDAALLQELQALYGGIPRTVFEDDELRRLMLPVLRGDLTVIETYRYEAEEPLSCPITVFSGDRDRAVPGDALEEWRHQTTAGFQHVRVNGDHFFLRSARDVVTARVRTELEGAIEHVER